MGIDIAHYHGWSGRLHSPWWATLSIVRVAVLQVFRRKLFWVVISLGLFHFVLYWAVIYAVTQANLPSRAQQTLYEIFGFQPYDSTGVEESGYIAFMDRQSLSVVILLAFAGSLIVGADFRQGALPFYLSRRVDRRHYIAGKLLAVSAIVSIMTTIPALLLFAEFGMFTESFDYWRDNWRIVVSVLAYGAVLCAVLSTLLVALSAYLQRVAPIAIAWSSMFVLLKALSALLQHLTDNPHWRLLDPWRNIRLVGKLCFGTFRDQAEYDLALWALVILSAACAAALAALTWRVRAVDVVV